jgi:nitric oxide reductase activation protein
VADDTEQDKPTLTGLAVKLGQLPAEKRRAALEVSAALAGISLRVSREFVEAIPKASKVLSADDIRLWGEFGRRLAMGNADTGVSYFHAGVNPLKHVPDDVRSLVFRICDRQLVLSSSTALKSFRLIPKIAAGIKDEHLLAEVLRLALDIAHRSAKHSAEFLESTPDVAKVLSRFGHDKRVVEDELFKLLAEFANRTGGMTADLWAGLPASLARLDARRAITLIEKAGVFLELGGSVTLHFVSSGNAVLQAAEQAFEDWYLLSRAIAKHGNAVLISFLRSTPKVFRAMATAGRHIVPTDIQRVLQLVAMIAETDAESALAAFKSSAGALKKVSVDQFDEWVQNGIRERQDDSSKGRRSYFALETRASNARLQQVRLGLPLESVQTVLRMYVEALTGKDIEIAPQSAMPQESRIGDGKTIYLPASVSVFDEDEMDFRLYKVLAAHGAGQIEFGTFERDSAPLRAAFSELSAIYSASADEKDLFSLGGYIEDVQKAQPASPEPDRAQRKKLPRNSDYRAVLTAFPEPRLARKIFGTMENARIDKRLRETYRGLRKDLDLMRSHLKTSHPYIFDLPVHQVPFELLFQITLCGGATDDARMFYQQVVSEIESVVESYLSLPSATVADSLMATSRVYNLFQNISAEQMQEAESDETEDNGEFSYDAKDTAEAAVEEHVKREPNQQKQDISELFNAWNSLDEEGEPDDLQGAEAWSQNEMPEQALDVDDVAFAYDEWDRDLNDYRVGWSRVIEKKVPNGDRNFVELTRSRYRGVISSIRHQFQLMKPENLTRINRELDGEDYDLNALVDFVIDKRADGRQSENIYTKRLRKRRDVAVSILLDQSSSTARTITRNPLQPYTHPGRRIIEIEKEGLVLMSEALEAVGDVYSINGFTSEGRRNVKFYIVKDFDENYSDDTERRIGGITFQNNTRLGAAVRHASAKLLKQEARTKLLIILTDGRPYDHDYGDARYAREDVREALTEAKTSGVTPFCVTIDRESESELRDLYGDVGYTIIDDVLSLPERMPNIYRRLTSQ